MTTATGATVELFYSDSWNDITSDVRVAGGITLTRGRADWAQQVSPGTCTLTIDNTDGKYSPRNPESSLYGLIGRNTKIRVSKPVGTEDFEDTSYALDIDIGTFTRDSTASHGGSWSAKAVTTADLTLTVPAGVTELRLWASRTVASATSATVQLRKDGAAVASQSIAAGWAEITFNVSGDTEYVIRGTAGGGTSTMWIDDITARAYRFNGEVESWPQRWDVSGKVAWVPITAYGILRRLGGVGTTAPAKSVLRRFYENDSTPPVAMWAMDSGQLSDTVPQTIGTGTGLSPTSTAHRDLLGVDSLSPWLGPGLSMTDAGSTYFGRADGLDTAPTATTLEATFSWEYNTGAMFAYWLIRQDAEDTHNSWEVQVQKTSGGVFSITVLGNDSASLLVNDTTNTTAISGLGPHTLRLGLVNSGSDVVWTIRCDDDTAISSGTATGMALKTYPYLEISSSLSTGGKIVFGPVAYYQATAGLHFDAPQGYPGETAADRLSRICTEEGIGYSDGGDDTVPLGPQGVLPVLGLLQEAADSDGGILGEDRTDLALTYVSHAGLLNPFTATLTLDYDESEVVPPLEPTEDTQHVRNDITVTRQNGASTHLVQETGTLNVQEPSDDADGVGRYATEVTLSLESDSQTLQQAAWMRHVGTWPDPRFPSITVDVTALAEASKTTLVANALSVDIGSLMVITNPPVYTGPDSVGGIVQGYVETIGSHHHVITFNVSPARLWFVNALGGSRVDTGGCVTAEALDTTETGVDVTNDDDGWSSTTPYDITIGGERMSVTGVSGTGSSQTLTVTRSVNGVTKSHATGAKVSLYLPSRLSR